MWDIKQMTLDTHGGQYEIAWQPGSGGYSLLLAPKPSDYDWRDLRHYVRGTIGIDDRDANGNSCDWDTLEDAKAACACHAEMCKSMNPWEAAENVWRELRKEAQAEEAANRWDANDYLGDGL